MNATEAPFELEPLPDLSCIAVDELEAAMMSALASAADGAAETTLHEVAHANGCGLFCEALAACGVTRDLDGASQVTILAVADDGFRTLPPSVTNDASLLRCWVEAHVCIGNVCGEAVQSLQGTVHRADYGAEHCGDRAVGIHEARHVGSARVTMVLPFRQGCVLLLDSPLYALQLESQCRPEQVWQKTVVPAPTLSLVGPPQGAHRCDGAVFADSERTLEAHAQLVHVPTGVTLPDTALRGGLRRIASRDDAVVTSRGMRSVRFTELAIEHKPSSCARKRATGAEQQRLQENCYTLAFTLLCPATGRVLGAIRQPGAITLRNSFHTLSETEKAFRRALNKPNGGGTTELILEPGTAASQAAVGSLPLPLPLDVVGDQHISTCAALVDLMPREGPAEGGTEVWIHGTDLREGLEVRFGNVAATNVRLCSPSLLKCATPPCGEMHGAAERVVQVSIATGSSKHAGSGPIAFTYRAVPCGDDAVGFGVRARQDAFDSAGSSEGEGTDCKEGPALKRRLIGLMDRIESSMTQAHTRAAADREADGQSTPTHVLHDISDDFSGWTLCHMLAALGANAELAAVLTRRITPPLARDRSGSTALHIALRRGHTVAAVLLFRAQRKLDVQWDGLWKQLDADTAGSETALRGLAHAAAASYDAMRAVEERARVFASSTAARTTAAGDGTELSRGDKALWDFSERPKDSRAADESQLLSEAAVNLRQRLLSAGGAARAIIPGTSVVACDHNQEDKAADVHAHGADAARRDERRQRLSRVVMGLGTSNRE